MFTVLQLFEEAHCLWVEMHPSYVNDMALKVPLPVRFFLNVDLNEDETEYVKIRNN
jgi:hypothetical protein